MVAKVISATQWTCDRCGAITTVDTNDIKSRTTFYHLKLWDPDCPSYETHYAVDQFDLCPTCIDIFKIAMDKNNLVIKNKTIDFDERAN